MRKAQEQDLYGGQDDQEDLYNDYSRSEIKQQIDQFPHQSFDVSSFNQSKAPTDLGSKYARHNFPVSHAPTLEISPERSIGKLGKLDHYLLDKDTATDQTARNQNQKAKNRIKYLQEQVSELQYRLQQKTEQCEEANNHANQLNIKTLKLQSQLRDAQKSLNDKHLQIIKQNSEIKQLRGNLSAAQSRRNNIPATINTRNSNSNSNQNSKGTMMSQQKSYTQQFCPQFLSQDETVDMLGQLLIKIDSSARMKKKIMKDGKIAEILSKMFSKIV